jgi:hypothetical protein
LASVALVVGFLMEKENLTIKTEITLKNINKTLLSKEMFLKM